MGTQNITSHFQFNPKTDYILQTSYSMIGPDRAIFIVKNKKREIEMWRGGILKYSGSWDKNNDGFDKCVNLLKSKNKTEAILNFKNCCDIMYQQICLSIINEGYVD